MTEAASDNRIRRATLDDLQGLKTLWEAMQFPVQDWELERRLTEFQVVEAADGRLLAALALEIVGRHGRLHCETFSDFALAETLRAPMWDRMQSVAANHGLVRLWTQETAPFWRHCGLHPADGEESKKLPTNWDRLPGEWLTIQLRDEAAIEVSLDKEFLKFKEATKAHTEQAMRRARLLKYGATFLAIVLAVVVCVICVYMLKNRSLLPPQP